MKHKIVIQSFLILALTFISSPHVFASEVTGNLSSNGVNNNQSTGSLSGSVISPSTSGGGGSGGGSGGSAGSGGSVLGVATQSSNSPSNTNLISKDGKSIQTSPRALAIASEIDSPTEEFAQIPIAEASTQTAAVAGAATGSGYWFWIALLALLIIALVAYAYYRDTRSRKIQRSIK